MRVTVKRITDWSRALNAARMTVGKKPLYITPSDEWVSRMLLAEHSPIRLVEYDITIEDVPMWVTVHYVRHHVGCEKFVCTQREDRNDTVSDRNSLPQGQLNNMMFTCNAQALINISRKRLCSKASKETRDVWVAVVTALEDIDPVMASKCVPECGYRGFCPEEDGCGYDKSKSFEYELNAYRNI